MRFKFKTSITTYSFNPPTSIDEEFYIEYRNFLKENPSFKVTEKELPSWSLDGGLTKRQAVQRLNQFQNELKDLVLNSTGYEDFIHTYRTCYDPSYYKSEERFEKEAEKRRGRGDNITYDQQREIAKKMTDRILQEINNKKKS